MSHSSNIFTSVLASSVRSWRGTSTKATAKPKQLITLYDREGCPDCRFVREALTELNLDARIVPCPEGNQDAIAALKHASGSSLVPFLFDPNTNKNICGEDSIVSYLFDEYHNTQAPKCLVRNLQNTIASRIATSLRKNAGTQSLPAKKANEPLTLYSFESSPYARLVRERLCEYAIPYTLINLGKQQRADLGPANFRMTLKPYKPLPNSKRETFFQQHGIVQVPFLIDPNTKQALFESKDILEYLERTYAA